MLWQSFMRLLSVMWPFQMKHMSTHSGKVEIRRHEVFFFSGGDGTAAASGSSAVGSCGCRRSFLFPVLKVSAKSLYCFPSGSS